MPGSILPPPVMPWRGSRPSARSCGAKASSVARLKPPKESGVAISIMRRFAGGDGLAAWEGGA